MPTLNAVLQDYGVPLPEVDSMLHVAGENSAAIEAFNSAMEPVEDLNNSLPDLDVGDFLPSLDEWLDPMESLAFGRVSTLTDDLFNDQLEYGDLISAWTVEPTLIATFENMFQEYARIVAPLHGVIGELLRVADDVLQPHNWPVPPEQLIANAIAEKEPPWKLFRVRWLIALTLYGTAKALLTVVRIFRGVESVVNFIRDNF